MGRRHPREDYILSSETTHNLRRIQMAMSTVCQTPDAYYDIHITEKFINVTVGFGRSLTLNEEEATLLDANVHNALELVLARYYVKETTT
jgi:hypothetical protein